MSYISESFTLFILTATFSGFYCSKNSKELEAIAWDKVVVTDFVTRPEIGGLIDPVTPRNSPQIIADAM